MSIIMKDNKNQSWSSEFNTDQLKNIRNTVNPHISPLGGLLFYFKPIWGEGLIETKGLFEIGGGVFNLKMTIVSVLFKELEYKVKKLKYTKF